MSVLNDGCRWCKCLAAGADNLWLYNIPNLPGDIWKLGVIVVTHISKNLLRLNSHRFFLRWIALPETNGSHLKMDGWNTILSFWETPVFQGRTVSFREGTPRVSKKFIEKKNLHFVHLYLMLISNMGGACKGNVGPTVLGAILYCDFYRWNSKHHPNSEKHQVFQTFYKFFNLEELEMILNFQMGRGLRSRNRLGPAQEALLSETADLDLLGAVSIQSCALVTRYDSITWLPYRNRGKNQYAHIRLFNMWQFAYASQKNLPRPNLPWIDKAWKLGDFPN